MIVFDLSCEDGHRFEGWFASSADYAAQQDGGLVSCPQCGSMAVEKAPMAPAVPRKGNQQVVLPPEGKQALARVPMPPQLVNALQQLAQVQARALADSQWVGDRFAEESRAMHYGEREAATIHGQATADQALELLEEGIPVASLPFPVAPPEDIN